MKEKKILGYDNMGYVFEKKNYIIRKIYNTYNNKVKNIYYLYKKNNLQNIGIINTFFLYKKKKITHPKYIISYPHEWSTNMFKDAVLFHLNLYLKLDKCGLTLKDGILNNILFNKSQPIFVDFFSLIFKKDLIKEKWLVKINNKNYSDLRFSIYDSMIKPFMILPFMFFAIKNNQFARKYLFHQYANVFQPNNFFYKISKIFWKRFYYTKYIFLYFTQNLITPTNYIKIKDNKNFISFLEKKISLIKKTDVSLIESGYSSYYRDKKEDYKCLSKLIF
jgi:hypothetical protein